MAKTKFHRLSAGVEAFLKTNPGVITLMSGRGNAVAAGVKSRNVLPHDGIPMPVVVKNGVSTWPGHSDRYVSQVTIQHPAAIPLEAKHGMLSSAAVGAGLEWGRKSKPRGGQG